MSRAARDRQLRRDTAWDRSALGRVLAEREEAREAGAKIAKAAHPALLDGLAEIHEWFTWLVTEHPSRPEIAALLQSGSGAAMDVVRGTEAAFALDPWAASDCARHLMEIEMLLIDFTHEPEHARLWLEGDPKVVQSRFAFGKARARHEQRSGLPERRFLPDRAECAMHSQTVHPMPPSLQTRFLPTPWDEISNLLGDLFGHASRVLQAGLRMSADMELECGQEAPEVAAIRGAEELVVQDMARFPNAYWVRPEHEAADWRAERAARLAAELADEPAGADVA
jgi:hypothetical protein